MFTFVRYVYASSDIFVVLFVEGNVIQFCHML